MLDLVMYLDVLLASVAGVLSVRLQFALFNRFKQTKELQFDEQCGILGALFGLFIGLLMVTVPNQPVPLLLEAAVPLSFIASPLLISAMIVSNLLYRYLWQIIESTTI